jgi:hypothetical protein
LIKVDKIQEPIIHPEDGKIFKIYLALEHIATEETKSQFIDKNISLLSTITNNKLSGYQNVAAQALLVSTLPQSLHETEDKFFNNIMGAKAQVTDIKEKVMLTKVGFRYFDLFTNDKQENFLQTVSADIMGLPTDFSISLIELIEEIEVSEPIKERVWPVVKDRSIALMDQELLGKVFSYYIDNEDIETLFNDILDKNIDTGISIVRTNKDKLSKNTANIIINSLINMSKGMGYDHLPTLFDLIVEIFGLSSPEYKNMFADRLLELVKEQNLHFQQVGLKYIDEVIDEISKAKWGYISEQLVRALPSPINSANIQITTNTVEGILKLQDYLSEEGRIGLIDFLLPMAKENLPRDFRVKGFEFLSRVRKLPRRRIGQVLDELFQVLKTEPEYFDSCSKALHNFDRYRKKGKFWEEVM